MKRLIGLRILVPTLALALLALAVSIASYLTHRGEQTYVQNAVTEQVRERLNHLQVSAELFVKLNRLDYLKQLVASVSAEPDLVHLLVVGPDGRILAANRFSQIGDFWHDAEPGLDPAQIKAVLNRASISTINAPGSRTVDSYAGLCGFAANRQLRPGACGFIAYRVDLAPHLNKTASILRNQTTYIAAAIFGVILALLLALDYLITRRARGVIEAVQAFSDGDRQQRIEVQLRDELTLIGTSVNQMFDEVARNEQAIMEQRERLRAVFDTVADAIITINVDGEIQSVNTATESLFGYDEHQLIGMNIDVLLPATEPDESRHFIQRQIDDSGKHLVGEAREANAAAKSGHTFPVELGVSEMQINGQQLYTCVVRDISERVAMREAMERVNAELISSNQQLWKSAKTDALTGIANRRSLDETLEAEMRRATRQGRPLSVILIDLDYFKRYNDTYGHIGGDTCLKAIATVLKECSQRSGELAARYGGEEFAVLLPDTDTRGVALVAEKIRSRIEQAAIPHESSDIADHVTASIGTTTFDPLTMLMPSTSALFEVADRALYQAKHAGRNQIAEASLRETINPGALTRAPDQSRG